MERHSSAYTEIVNIIHAAQWHKAHCQDSECDVSLWLLGMTAKRLVNHCWLSEKRVVNRFIEETNWR